MRPVIWDVAWSECLSVGHKQQLMSSALKWLNQSRCCFGCRLVGPRIHVLGGARIPEGNGQFCWVISQPIMKYKEYVVRAKVISRWQQWCGLLLSVVQQLVHHWQVLVTRQCSAATNHHQKGSVRSQSLVLRQAWTQSRVSTYWDCWPVNYTSVNTAQLSLHSSLV